MDFHGFVWIFIDFHGVWRKGSKSHYLQIANSQEKFSSQQGTLSAEVKILRNSYFQANKSTGNYFYREVAACSEPLRTNSVAIQMPFQIHSYFMHVPGWTWFGLHSRSFQNLLGTRVKYIKNYKNPWKSIGIHDNPNKSMKNHENLWKLRKIMKIK